MAVSSANLERVVFNQVVAIETFSGELTSRSTKARK
jgi:hypothetical protein